MESDAIASVQRLSLVIFLIRLVFLLGRQADADGTEDNETAPAPDRSDEDENEKMTPTYMPPPREAGLAMSQNQKEI